MYTLNQQLILIKMSILKLISQWKQRRRGLKMLKHTIIVLKGFNHILSQQGVSRAMRHRYMRAISKNPDELIRLWKELWY